MDLLDDQRVRPTIRDNRQQGSFYCQALITTPWHGQKVATRFARLQGATAMVLVLVLESGRLDSTRIVRSLHRNRRQNVSVSWVLVIAVATPLVKADVQAPRPSARGGGRYLKMQGITPRITWGWGQSRRRRLEHRRGGFVAGRGSPPNSTRPGSNRSPRRTRRGSLLEDPGEAGQGSARGRSS